MCEAMGAEPIDDDIPVEYDDLYPEIQYALGIYAKLKDEWDTFNGNYLGKNYNGIADIFNIYEVHKDDARTMFDLIDIIDQSRSKMIQDSKPKK
jgi:hypothetical protein